MKWPVPTCSHPTDPSKLYFHLMYHTFFFGPFDTIEAVGAALQTLDKFDPMWSYDCFQILRGAATMPTDYVFGFPTVSHEERLLAEATRRAPAPDRTE